MKCKRLLTFFLALCLTVTLLPGAVPRVAAAAPGTRTFNAYDVSLSTCWNPHTWENDDYILNYITTPLVAIAPKNTATGEYQWIFLAATDIQDVTARHQDDLVKYGSDETSANYGYVYEIALNPEMCWEDGTPITADTYIYSMRQLLDPVLKNLRSNTFHSGATAIAGAYAYYNSKEAGMYIPYAKAYDSLADATAAETLYIDCWSFWGAKGYIDSSGNSCPQYVSILDETVYSADGYGADQFSGASLFEEYGGLFEIGTGYEVYVYVYITNDNADMTFDEVGLYKVDDYTIRYVCQSAVDYPIFLTSMTSNWLVYRDLYENGNYCTSAATTMSYGPYRMESYSSGSMVFSRNKKYFEYDVQSTGAVTSTSSFKVDGEHVSQWQADRIVITKLYYASDIREAFLRGDLDLWTPTAEELASYTASTRLYRAPETYTQRLFFNTDVDTLKALDRNGANNNSVVLSNHNFRKAFSLAIQREELATATPGYKASYTLINELYYYDVYNNPNSVYRYSDQAKAAICDLYGVSYTASTLDQAYRSITGYDLSQAKTLMAKACEELVAAGLYTKGEPVVIEIAWGNKLVSDSHIRQSELLSQYLNAAAQGSGFGKITLQATRNISHRYTAVPNGEVAVGAGAWGGAAFYPFQIMQVYCDSDMYELHEGGCWDPTVETLTLNIAGTDHTMTWQNWSNSMVSGKFAGSGTDVKLEVLSKLEAAYLGQYYCIPLQSTTSCDMLSYKCDYFTKNYSVMYGFGDIRLIQFHYTDTQWEDYVASGKLDYSTDSSDSHIHSYSTLVVPATCTEQGYTVHTCACGDSYTDSYTDPIGHNFSDGLCRNCGQVRIIEGENSTWEPESEESHSIRIEAQPEELLNVYMNGKLVDPSNYTVTHGSTIITFKPEYLATLPEGEHTISVEFTVGTAIATLTVTAPAEPENPGEETDSLLGDVDGNDEVDTTDAYLIVMYYNERMDLEENQLLAADVDGNGEVDTTDAYYIVMYYNEKIDAFPAQQ